MRGGFPVSSDALATNDAATSPRCGKLGGCGWQRDCCLESWGSSPEGKGPPSGRATDLHHVAIVAALLMAGCVVASPPPRRVVVTPPPAPALPAEAIPPSPGPGYVWVAGHWAWTGNGYAWQPGFRAVLAQPGYVWVPGHWQPRRGGFVWIGGHWRAR
jgi:hypothetical protein